MVDDLRGDELPAITLKPRVDNYSVFDLSLALRERGWQVPAHTFPENRTDLAVLRVVVRRGFTHDMADLLLADVKRQLQRLEQQNNPEPCPGDTPHASRTTIHSHR